MSAAAAVIASLSERKAFERHRPEDTTLHRVVRENLKTLYAALDEEGTTLPAFVRNELDGYAGCGVLTRGFRMLRCDGCRETQLVAFSCGGRGFCPSCLGRRMAQTASNLVEHVLPAGPLRQLTLPFSLRSRLAYDGELLGAVGHLFTDSVLGFYRRRCRGLLDERDDGQTELVLRPDDTLTKSEPALARLAQTAVGTQPPAGPELRRRTAELGLPGRPGFTISAALCVAEQGFSLHAATRSAHTTRARESDSCVTCCVHRSRPNDCRCCPTILRRAQEVRLELKKPFGDGTVAIELDPLSLLWRLCAAVPSPRRHTIGYSGVLSSHAKWRSRIVPRPVPEPAAPTPAATPAPATVVAPSAAGASRSSRQRSRRRSRAELLARSFGLPDACPSCGGRLHLHAVVQDCAILRQAQDRRILKNRGEPTEPPPLSPARGPPPELVEGREEPCAPAPLA